MAFALGRARTHKAEKWPGSFSADALSAHQRSMRVWTVYDPISPNRGEGTLLQRQFPLFAGIILSQTGFVKSVGEHDSGKCRITDCGGRQRQSEDGELRADWGCTRMRFRRGRWRLQRGMNGQVIHVELDLIISQRID